MQEAVDNLVKNAFDHTKSGDTIQVEWNALPSMVQIKVRDNGSGIHPEDLYHIFKRFYRSRFSQDKQKTPPPPPTKKNKKKTPHQKKKKKRKGRGTPPFSFFFFLQKF